jgi:hypothetical protein
MEQSPLLFDTMFAYGGTYAVRGRRQGPEA